MGFSIALLFLPLCMFFSSVECQNWTDHVVLDEEGKVHLYWNYDLVARVIEMRFEMAYLGCFGVGFSPDGELPNSDIVVGWISEGKTFFQDRYSNESGVLINDEQQDYKLNNAYENDTWTVFEFSRLFDTCDIRDIPITNSTMRVIFGVDDDDPPDELADMAFYPKVPVYSKSTLFFQPRIEEDLDLNSPSLSKWEVLAPEVDISSTEAVFWCKIVKSPDVTEKNHIIHAKPNIQKGHEKFVFHMALYECVGGTPNDFEKHVESRGHECYHPEMPEEMLRCQGLTVGWGVGGRDIMLPEEAGFPLNKDTYYLFEANYANPELLPDIIDTSGLTMFYTNNVRPNDAAVYVAGASIIPRAFIPPGLPDYLLVGHSNPECIQSGFPEDGAYIFAVGPHTRMLGRRMKIRHFRGNEELVPLVNDQNLDPLYQEYRYKDPPVQVLKGDQLTAECSYNSSKKSTVTFGGMRTTDEICVGVMMYFIKSTTNRSISLSGSTYANINRVFNSNVNNEMELAGFLSSYDWSSANIDEIQDVMANSELESQCYAGPFFENQETTLVGYPSDLIPYVPEPTCSG